MENPILKENISNPLLRTILENRNKLTPKGRILADFVIENPVKTVFMTTRELSEASGVSEATIVRFVSRLGYAGYSEFNQALRNLVDAELTLPDRMDLVDLKSPSADRFRRMVFNEMDGLKQLYECVDFETVHRVVDDLSNYEAVFVIGSRLSYTLAYYMGWSLIKVRGNIQILKGSDSTSIDRLTVAPKDSLAVIITASRYPNELIRIAKQSRRLGHKVVVVTDSSNCPLLQFAHEMLICQSRSIPYFGNPTTLSCLINFLIQEAAMRRSDDLKPHQTKLEQAYRENDILFSY